MTDFSLCFYAFFSHSTVLSFSSLTHSAFFPLCFCFCISFPTVLLTLAAINVFLRLHPRSSAQSISVLHVCVHEHVYLWLEVLVWFCVWEQWLYLGRIVCVASRVCIFLVLFACSTVCFLHREYMCLCACASAYMCICWHKRLLCALGVNWLRSFVNILLASLLVRNRAGKLMSLWFSSRETKRKRERERKGERVRVTPVQRPAVRS